MRTLSIIKVICVSLAVPFLVSGCFTAILPGIDLAHPQQAYPGAPQPNSATALIVTYREVLFIPVPGASLLAWGALPVSNFGTCIYAINRQPFWLDERRNAAQILPGEYVLDVGVYQNSTARCFKNVIKRVDLRFVAQPGRAYVVNGKIGTNEGCVSLRIERFDQIYEDADGVAYQILPGDREVIATDGVNCDADDNSK